MTGLLDALETDGLVRREADPTDRRALLVSLAEQGRSLTAALRSGRDELAAELFQGMPDEQVAAFTAGLETVIERLRSTALPDC
ncbi:hypothetical protein SUDANB51_06995 [Streptomyces sp. enrichment culture]